MKTTARTLLLSALLLVGPVLAQTPPVTPPPTAAPPDTTRDYSRSDNSGMDYDPNKANLTDEEWKISKTYFNEAKSQRELQEKCGKDESTQDACDGMDAAKSYSFISMAAKAYALVMGMSGLGGGFEKTDAAKASSKTEDGKKDTEDYCKYIAVATEAIATIQQTTAQSNLQSTTNAENAQIEHLNKAKLSHEERAKTARIQGIGWTASAVCYAGYMAMPGISLDPSKNAMLYIKFGACTTFAIFSWMQVAAHEKYADKIQKIIDEFETKKGNCNPVTERDCYCSEPTTENDPKYCAPQMHSRAIAAGNLRISCVNKALQADPKCSCMASNSCFDTAWYNMTSGMNFGQSADTVNRMVKDMSRGELTSGGRLNSGAVGQNARQQLRSRLGLLVKAQPLKGTQGSMAEAKILSEMTDLPPGAAMAIAALPMDARAQSQMNAMKANSARTAASMLDAQKLSRSGGSAMYFGSDGASRGKKATGGGIDLSALNKLKKGPAAKDNNMNWAKEAEKAAQITKQSDQDIFKIISRRYQVTGRRLLNITE